MERSPLKIADIIVASLKGEITADKQAVLDAWLSQSEGNRNLYLRLSDELIESDIDKLFSIEDSWNALASKLELANNSELSRSRIKAFPRKYLKYAAIFILPLILAVFASYYSSRPRNSSIELLAEFTKEYRSNKVMLVNSEGETTAVDQFFRGGKDGVRKVNPKMLSYVSSSDDNAEAVNRIVVPRGKTFTVELSDGSTVRLNSESELIYPSKFSKRSRTVILKGEGYFEVTKNQKAPFRVKTPSYTVKVLGTTFNVKAYTDDPLTTTTLCSGHVNIEDLANSKTGVELLPGQQITENKLDGSYTKKLVVLQDQMSWVKDRFTFEQAPIATVLKTLERAYDVKFIFDEDKFKGDFCTCNMNRYEDIQRCLDILEYGHNLKITQRNSMIYITKKR